MENLQNVYTKDIVRARTVNSSCGSCQLVAQSNDIHGDGNFLQGCSFSPDGLCILTHTVTDAKLRLYNTPLQSSEINCNLNHDISGDNSRTDDVTIAIQKDWSTVLTSNCGDSVRCYTWYPLMNSSDPATCCLIAASRDQPVHLYDAYNANHVRASYRPYNSLDEMEAPNVVTFTNNGQHIICGGFHTDRTIHVFDTTIPGRDSTVLRLGKTRRSSDGQKGLISSICCGGGASLSSPIFAVGTYSPGSIYLYDLRSSQQPTGTILNGHCVVGHGKGHARKKRRIVKISKEQSVVPVDDAGSDHLDENDENWFSAAKGKWFQSKTQSGVTQLQFAPNDEYILYSTSRRSNVIIAWDTRMLSGQSDYQSNPIRGLSSYETINDTNQRLEFDIDPTGQTIYVGGQDNCVRIYDIKSGKCKDKICDLHDVANGVSVSNRYGRTLLTIATGSRRFASLDDDCQEVNERIVYPPGYLYLYDCNKN